METVCKLSPFLERHQTSSTWDTRLLCRCVFCTFYNKHNVLVLCLKNSTTSLCCVSKTVQRPCAVSQTQYNVLVLCLKHSTTSLCCVSNTVQRPCAVSQTQYNVLVLCLKHSTTSLCCVSNTVQRPCTASETQYNVRTLRRSTPWYLSLKFSFMLL